MPSRATATFSVQATVSTCADRRACLLYMQERRQFKSAGKPTGSRLKPRRPLLPLAHNAGSPGGGTPGSLAPSRTTPLKFRTRRGAARAKCARRHVPMQISVMADGRRQMLMAPCTDHRGLAVHCNICRAAAHRSEAGCCNTQTMRASETLMYGLHWHLQGPRWCQQPAGNHVERRGWPGK